MKGLELAERYYLAVGLPMLRSRFAGWEERVAAGLAGPGSECFGFDDAISRDHDWGPAFCLWLGDGDYDEIGDRLRKAYLELPPLFMGFGPRKASPGEEWRVGPCRTSDFFRRFIGLDRPPATLQEWLRIPEANLAACTNGKIFSDPGGGYTRWREALLGYYPEDVRLSKIADLCLTIGQTGQYNFARSVRRAEPFAAAYSAVKFCADSIALVFLLNRRYAPFYKWLHRAVDDLPILGSAIHERVGALLQPAGPARREEIMEETCVLLADELRRQGLSDCPGDFLLEHAPRVRARITDPELGRP
jgi:hypothetical protein